LWLKRSLVSTLEYAVVEQIVKLAHSQVSENMKVPGGAKWRTN
jgi:hypothetical protein